jgi:hypothetical protein
MTDLLHRLAGTVLLRPYVFVFLLAYLFLAVARLGWLRTLVWTVTAYLIAWACEWEFHSQRFSLRAVRLH